MNVFDGTQSDSTHAPPAPSGSTIVTSASSCAATRAASYPAGPAPMITMRSTSAPSSTRTYGAVARTYCHQRISGHHDRHTTRSSYSLSPPERTIVIAVRNYAAYGSNLDPGRMRAYCPQSPMVGTGWLEGWRLTFSGEEQLGWETAVTTIVESPGDRVFVALYDVHEWDASQLDELEGVTSGMYQKLTVRIATLEGDVTSWVYVFDGYEGGLPTSWYLS